MLNNEGLTYLIDGDDERGDAVLVARHAAAAAAGAMPLAAMILVERGIVKLAHDDGDGTDALATEALDILRAGEFDDYPTSGGAVARASPRRAGHRRS